MLAEDNLNITSEVVCVLQPSDWQTACRKRRLTKYRLLVKHPKLNCDEETFAFIQRKCRFQTSSLKEVRKRKPLQMNSDTLRPIECDYQPRDEPQDFRISTFCIGSGLHL